MLNGQILMFFIATCSGGEMPNCIYKITITIQTSAKICILMAWKFMQIKSYD